MEKRMERGPDGGKDGQRDGWRVMEDVDEPWKREGKEKKKYILIN